MWVKKKRQMLIFELKNWKTNLMIFEKTRKLISLIALSS